MPWAAPANGRQQVSKSELDTVAWLFGEQGLVPALGEFTKTETVIMPADSYADRNNFCMASAQMYWKSVQKLVAQDIEVTFLPASVIEGYTIMDRYLAQEAYAFDKLNKRTQFKVQEAAVKYSGCTPDEAYMSAADYSMRRAAEARFVEYDLQALWVSLNWPERDTMCGESPRIYVPESLRTPWLKEQ